MVLPPTLERRSKSVIVYLFRPSNTFEDTSDRLVGIKMATATRRTSEYWVVITDLIAAIVLHRLQYRHH